MVLLLCKGRLVVMDLVMLFVIVIAILLTLSIIDFNNTRLKALERAAKARTIEFINNKPYYIIPEADYIDLELELIDLKKYRDSMKHSKAIQNELIELKDLTISDYESVLESIVNGSDNPQMLAKTALAKYKQYKKAK